MKKAQFKHLLLLKESKNGSEIYRKEGNQLRSRAQNVVVS